MKTYLGITIVGVLLVTNLGFAKSKKRKHRNKAATSQIERVTPEKKEQKKPQMDLTARCLSYCEFTQKCLDSICSEIATVPVETCFNQCLKAEDLSQQEHDQTLQRGCLRTQSIYCQTGLLDKKCKCPQGAQAGCQSGQLCNLPLSNGHWACGSPQAELPGDLSTCNSLNPCPDGTVCAGIFSSQSSGVCLSQCVNPTTKITIDDPIPAASPTQNPKK